MIHEHWARAIRWSFLFIASLLATQPAPAATATVVLDPACGILARRALVDTVSKSVGLSSRLLVLTSGPRTILDAAIPERGSLSSSQDRARRNAEIRRVQLELQTRIEQTPVDHRGIRDDLNTILTAAKQPTIVLLCGSTDGLKTSPEQDGTGIVIIAALPDAMQFAREETNIRHLWPQAAVFPENASERAATRWSELATQTQQAATRRGTPKITIRAPKQEAVVSNIATVEGDVSDPNVPIAVLIHPFESASWWVQPTPTVDSRGQWIGECYFGTPGLGVAQKYAIVAITTRRPLSPGEPLADLPKDIVSKSAIVTVTRK